MTDMKPLAVKAKAFWACTQDKNKLSNKYQIDLAGLSDQAADLLKQRGISVKKVDGDDRGNYITVKSNNPIKAYDTSGTEIGALIGNGSTLKALVGYYDWEFSGKRGRSPSAVKIIVEDLVIYEGNSDNSSAGMEGAI